MRVRTKKQFKEKPCADCGITIIPGSGHQSRCKECQHIERKKQRKDFRLKYPEKTKAQIRDWKKRNPDYYYKWKSKNPELAKRLQKISHANWRARLRAAGTITMETIRQVYKQNLLKYGDLTCYLCGEKIDAGKEHMDHKLPLSRGGKNELSNLEIACSFCNQSKNSKTVEEYLEWLKVTVNEG